MVRKESIHNVRRGMTIRFPYGMESKRLTVLVLKRTSSSLTCKIECGRNRDKIRSFEQFEMTNCKELFAASSLQDLLSQAKSSVWVDATKNHSCNISECKPKLRQKVNEDEKFKRR